MLYFGGEPMRRAPFAVGALVVAFIVTGCDQQKPRSQTTAQANVPTQPVAQAAPDATATPAPASEVGRYTIVHSPHIQSDTVLLDTVTGQTWQLVQAADLNGDPVIWQPMDRIDGPSDWAIVVAKYGRTAQKSAPVDASEQNTAAQPTAP